MAIDFDAVENKIRAAVRDALQLSDDVVIWFNQDGTRPAETYATVRINTIAGVGQSTSTHDFDEHRPVGQEIEFTFSDLNELPVTVQVFTPKTVGGPSAHAVLSRLRLGLEKPSVRDPLTAVGLSPFDVGTVTNLAENLGVGWSGRASCDVRFYVTDVETERTTYIETYEAEHVDSLEDDDEEGEG